MNNEGLISALRTQLDGARRVGAPLRVSLMMLSGNAVGGVLLSSESGVLEVRSGAGEIARVCEEAVVSFIIKQA